MVPSRLDSSEDQRMIIIGVHLDDFADGEENLGFGNCQNRCVEVVAAKIKDNDSWSSQGRKNGSVMCQE
jgi:hypothetical protein